AGYLVEAVHDGSLALARLQASHERLVVLLDLYLPKMDGVELMRAVMSDQVLTRRHAFILMTAQEEWLPSLFRLVLRNMHTPVLAKPFPVQSALSQVRQAEQRLQGGAL